MITRASEAAYDILCPGRALAQSGIKEPEASEDAKFGKTIHIALAKDDPAGLDSRQLDIFNSCKDIVTNAVTDYFGVHAPHAIQNAVREKELEFVVSKDHRHIGHPDVIYRFSTRALIPDFKTLHGEHADADENLQLRDYIALYAGHTLLLDEVATAIIQPLVSHNPVICVYDRPAILQAMQRMEARVHASADPNSPRLPGEKQCKFCRASRHCLEYQSWVGNKLPVLHGVFNVPVAQWSPEQRAIFCQNRQIAKQWLDDTEQAMKDLLKSDPASIPGWMLKEGNEVDVLTDLQKIYERFVSIGGKHEAFMECLSGVRIKGKLKDAIRVATGATGKTLDKTVDAVIDGASVSKRNAPSLTKKD